MPLRENLIIDILFFILPLYAMKLFILVSFLSAAAAAAADTLTALGHSPGLNLTTAEAGNPLFDGWFADPEIRVYDDVFWIFATTSVAFEKQKHFDAWSSTDLVQWYTNSFRAPSSCLSCTGF